MFYFTLIGLAAAFAVMLLFGAMELDRALLFMAYAGERPEVARVARALTELGGARFLIPVTGGALLFLLLTRRWLQAVLLLFATAAGTLLVELLKANVGRLRPDYRQLAEVEPLAFSTGHFGFPSAHAADSTIVFLAIALLLTDRHPARTLAVWAAVWLSLAIGATRVVLGVHWPTDVIGGWIFGLFWTLLLLRLSGRDLGDGTPRPARHFPPKGEDHERPEQPQQPGPTAR